VWTGAIGGLVSSTAVTLSASRQAKSAPELVDFSALSIAVASTVMAVRVLIVAGATNAQLMLRLLWPMLAVAMAGILYAGLLVLRSRKRKAPRHEPALTNPFELGSTLQMATLLVGVMLFSTWATESFGQRGAYVTAFFSGLTDVDAITLSMANLSQAGGIETAAAAISVFIAVFANTVVKGGLAAVLGTRALAVRVALGFAAMMAAGGVGLALGARLHG